MRTPGPVVLSDDRVRLEPLTDEHGPALTAAAGDDGDELFRWTSMWAGGATADPVAAVRRAGAAVSWAVVRRATVEVVGSTSFLDVSVPDRRLEIGGTWLARSAWCSEVNTAMKLLLLTHAFDELGAERVALKTDANNLRSQRAIERLGGVREGVLRHHMRNPDGTWRDTVYYSVLRAEWPAARDRLRASVGA